MASNNAFPVRYDYMESVKIRDYHQELCHRGNSQCHGAQASSSKWGRSADLHIVICLPQVFNTPEQLVNEVYVTWIDRIEWEIRSQIPSCFVILIGTKTIQYLGLLVPTCMPCFESGQPENTAHWRSVNMFRKHRVLATLTC